MAPASDPIVSPMPVATHLFTPGGKRHERRLLFVGRLNAQKGIAGLLAAVAAMRERVELDVVGTGVDRDALARLAGELGIADRVRWHGALRQPELLDYYRAATALVVPSTDEGFGLVAVEALLCETPVIAFASGGLPDIIEDHVTGYLVVPGDQAQLVRVLDDVVTSERRHEVGKAGRQSALGRFSPESVARRYRLLYDTVVGEYS
jgi:glycosyltransferase involved in cell wall biosynthesis